MKTSWNEIALIEQYLDKDLSEEETRSFEDQLTCDGAFKANVVAQTHVRTLIRKHYLIQTRRQAKALHNKLYNDPARRLLRQAIDSLFKY